MGAHLDLNSYSSHFLFVEIKISGKLIEYANVQRIHRIFRRALKKYRGDIKLWLQVECVVLSQSLL
jgi:hypothetical protein